MWEYVGPMILETLWNTMKLAISSPASHARHRGWWSWSRGCWSPVVRSFLPSCPLAVGWAILEMGRPRAVLLGVVFCVKKNVVRTVDSSFGDGLYHPEKPQYWYQGRPRSWVVATNSPQNKVSNDIIVLFNFVWTAVILKNSWVPRLVSIQLRPGSCWSSHLFSASLF